MAADVGISANDDSHYLPPPLGGGGSFSCVLLLRLRASYPSRRPPHSRVANLPRLRALPVEQSALRGANYLAHSRIRCYGSRCFLRVLSVCQDSRGRHPLHTCSARIVIFVVFFFKGLMVFEIIVSENQAVVMRFCAALAVCSPPDRVIRRRCVATYRCSRHTLQQRFTINKRKQ